MSSTFYTMSGADIFLVSQAALAVFVTFGEIAFGRLPFFGPSIALLTMRMAGMLPYQ